MDTSNFLLRLLQVKEKPGELPIIRRKEHLNIVENAVVIDHAEQIFHYAAIFNEPSIIEYLLDRYNLNPNSSPASGHSTYIYCSMFRCVEAILVFFERNMFPDNWYVFFLFSNIFGDESMIYYVLRFFRDKVKLQHHELVDLERLAVSPILKQYCQEKLSVGKAIKA